MDGSGLIGILGLDNVCYHLTLSGMLYMFGMLL